MWTEQRLWSDDEAIMVMFKVYQKQPLPIPSYIVLSDLGKDFKHRRFAMQVCYLPSCLLCSWMMLRDLEERISHRTLATSVLGASRGLGI
ncbi:hypothetical protein BDR06DRAFT_2539 [Suillus hirtellus]|nr:hypothetical protein BDR06DRAFT_2539 [Suillus hirtellus]